MRMFPLSATALIILVGSVTAGSAMSEYRWKNRPLVVFAPSDSSPLLAEQRRIVAKNRVGLGERDMVVIWVVGDSTSADLGSRPAAKAAALRARYGVADGAFRAILVGKDGGQKLASSQPIEAGKLFATIDAMPMRRDEMR